MSSSSNYKLLFEGSKLNAKEHVLMELLQEVDSSLAIDLAQVTYLAPLLHKSISGFGKPVEFQSEFRKSLQNSYNQVLVRNIALQQVFIEFGLILNSQNIDVVPLKGIYLSETLYGDIGARHLSDIDVLVKESDLERICNLMESEHWEIKSMIKHSKLGESQFEHAHTFTLIKNGTHIELHTHLYNQNQGVRIARNQIWEHTHDELFLGIKTKQFSNEMLLQHQCLHLHKHLFGHELKVVSFCDIREILRVRKDDFDWGLFKSLCEKYGCLEDVKQILFLCNEHWDVWVPEELIEPELSTSILNERFWQFFTGANKDDSQALKNKREARLREIQHLDGFSNKLAFLSGITFPKRTFMQRTYRLNADQWVLPYYLFRPVELAIKFIRSVFS